MAQAEQVSAERDMAQAEQASAERDMAQAEQALVERDIAQGGLASAELDLAWGVVASEERVTAWGASEEHATWEAADSAEMRGERKAAMAVQVWQNHAAAPIQVALLVAVDNSKTTINSPHRTVTSSMDSWASLVTVA